MNLDISNNKGITMTKKEIQIKISGYKNELMYANLSLYAESIYEREIKRLEKLLKSIKGQQWK